MEPKLGEIIRSLRASNFSDEKIASELRRAYGVNVSSIPATAEPGSYARALRQVGEAVAGVPGRLAAVAVGPAVERVARESAANVPLDMPPSALIDQGPPMSRAQATAESLRTVAPAPMTQKQRQMSRQRTVAALKGLKEFAGGATEALMPGISLVPGGTGVPSASLSSSAGIFDPLQQAVAEGRKAYLEGTYEPRLGEHPVTNIARALADPFTGALEMAGLSSELLGGEMSPEQAKQVGKALAGGVVGAPVAMAEKFVEDPVEAVKTDPGMLLMAAPLMRAAPARALPSLIKRRRDKILESPAARNIAAELSEQVARKDITPKAAARRFGRLVLDRDVILRGERLGSKIAGPLKQSGVGALLGLLVADGYITEGAAAAIGAATPQLAKFLKSAVPIERRAAISRAVQDWTRQATEAETDIARGMTRVPEAAKNEIGLLFREFASRVEKGQVKFEPLPADPKKRARVTVKRPVVEEQLEVFPSRGALGFEQKFEPAGVPAAARRALDVEAASQSALLKTALPKARRKTVADRLKEIATPTQRELLARQKVQAQRSRAPVRIQPGHADDIIDRAVGVINQYGGTTDKSAVARWFTDAMLKDGLSLLRSPRARGAVEKSLMQKFGLSRSAVASLDDRIVQALATETRRMPASLRLRLGGKEISLQDLVAEAAQSFRSVDKKGYENWVRQAINRVGLHVATQSEKTVTANAILSEINRFKATKTGGSASHLDWKGISRRIDAGEQAPMFVTKQTLADMRKSGAKEASEFVQVPSHISRMIKEVAGKQIPADMMIKKGLADTLGVHLQSLGYLSEANQLVSMLRSGSSLLAPFAQQAKLGLTAFRVGTHINNIVGNTIYQSLRTGSTPLKVFSEMIAEGQKYRAFYQGKVTNPAEVRFQRSVQKTGGLDTSFVDDDLSKFARTAIAAGSPVVAVPKKLIKGTQKFATRTYKAGDSIAKLQEVRSAYNHIMKDLNRLSDGRYIDLQIKGDRKIRITKEGNSVVIDGKKVALNSQELSDVVAAAGMKSALDIYFDYGAGGAILKKMKGQELLQAVHPFFSWTYFASDIPGVKKGLLSHLLDYSGGRMSSTNDPALMARNMARAIGVSASRSSLVNSMRAVSDQERDVMGDVLGWNPGGVNVLASWDRPDSDVVDVVQRPGLNMFEATSNVLRLGPKFLHATLGESWSQDNKWSDEFIKKHYWLFGDPKSFKKRQKQVRKYWADYEAGRDLQPSQALSVMGLGMGLLASEIFRLQQDKAESPKAYAKIAWRLGRMILGGTPTDALDAYVSTKAPASVWSTRLSNPETGEWEPVAKLWARKLLSLGTRQQMLRGKKGAIRRWINERRSFINKSKLLYKKELDRSFLAGDDESYNKHEAILERLEEIFDEEIDRMADKVDSVREKPARPYKETR